MAERQKRRRFTAEFKAEAVKRLLDGGKGLGEVATELGLSPGQLSGGRNEHLAAGSAEALAARKAEQAELQRLKRENRRLEEEVEILRKAAAFFARGTAGAGPPSAPPSGRTTPSPRCAAASARASAASTPGCARSLPSAPGPRRRPSCATASAAPLPPPAPAARAPPGAASTARRGSTPSCAGRAGATPAGAWRG